MRAQNDCHAPAVGVAFLVEYQAIPMLRTVVKLACDMRGEFWNATREVEPA